LHVYSSQCSTSCIGYSLTSFFVNSSFGFVILKKQIQKYWSQWCYYNSMHINRNKIQESLHQRNRLETGWQQCEWEISSPQVNENHENSGVLGCMVWAVWGLLHFGRLLIKDTINDRKTSRQHVLKFYKNQPVSMYLWLRWIWGSVSDEYKYGPWVVASCNSVKSSETCVEFYWITRPYK
jgi:hypothetical protein